MPLDSAVIINIQVLNSCNVCILCFYVITIVHLFKDMLVLAHQKKKEEPWVLSDAVRISFQEVHILYITCAISLQQTDISLRVN